MARSQTPVDEDLGQPKQYDPDFNGPLKNRSCTDVICLLVFLIFIGCWIGIGIYAFKSGDPNTLLVPKDSLGSRCGLDDHVKNKPNLFFMDLTKCFSPSVPFTGCPTLQICVEKCPDKYYSSDVDKQNDAICNYDIDPKSLSETQFNHYVEQGQCAKWYLPSSPFKERCIPFNIDKDKVESVTHMNISQILDTVKNLKVLSQAEQVTQNIVDDLINSWWKILIGIGIAVVTSIIYIVIMRWIASIMVWFSLIGLVALLSFCTYFTCKKYIDLKNNPQDNNDDKNLIESYLTKKDTWLVLLIISASVLAIILLILIFLRKRILLAIELIREGSKAVASVTSVLFFPIFPWILQIGVIAFAVCVGLFLSTTGEPLYKVKDLNNCQCINSLTKQYYKDNEICYPNVFKQDIQNCDLIGTNSCSQIRCKFISMQNPMFYPYLQAINVFGFFWGAFFVSALGQMILATVFATWYWTFKKSRLPFFAVTSATLQTLRYHIGTLAFGSLIITICRIIRVCLEYVDHKLKKYDNEITRAIMCCCKCFFWCLEKFLKFINRNAYIMCAIHGKNFCFSAKDAFMLLMRNIIRVFVLDKVTDFLFFIGKLLITLGVGAIAYVCFATDLTTIDNSGLNYNLVPVITVMIFTYFIATIFFNVYTMAVDTLFLCFLEDCERNDGSAEKPYYMSKNLMRIFGKKNKKH